MHCSIFFYYRQLIRYREFIGVTLITYPQTRSLKLNYFGISIKAFPGIETFYSVLCLVADVIHGFVGPFGQLKVRVKSSFPQKIGVF